MMHLSLLLFTISVFSLLVVQSSSQSCGSGLKEAAVENGEATKIHNRYRQMLNQGDVPNQPKSKHIEDLKFDDALAQEALKLVKTCDFGGDVHDSRFQVGQNSHKYCFTPPKEPDTIYDDALENWYDEHTVYHYPDDLSEETGHYTQIMWQKTKYVGCAHSQWEEMKDDGLLWRCKFVVCNYGPAGNYIGQPPYERA